MEGMSRVKKYKNLRDSITNGEETIEAKEEKDDLFDEIDGEDDFLDFPEFKLEEELSITGKDLIEDETKETMSRAKDGNGEVVGYTTRYDILQQIKAATKQNTVEPAHMKKGEKTVTEKVEEPKVEDEDFQQSISDIIKNDDIKIKKEVKEQKEEIINNVIEDPEITEVEVEEEFDEEYEEKSGITEKILTFIIIVFSIALIAMIGYIIKLFLS